MGGIWFGLVGWLGWLGWYIRRPSAVRRMSAGRFMMVLSGLTFPNAVPFPLLDEFPGVEPPVMDHAIRINPSVAQCLVEWAGLTGPFRASRNFCGGEPGQSALRRVVQSPPPETMQVADCLCFMNAELAGEPNQFRMPYKRLMRFNPSHDLQPDSPIQTPAAHYGGDLPMVFRMECPHPPSPR